jgi:hypothetical protein
MPDNNLPASAGPVDVPAPLPTEDSLIEDISDLLDDSPASANPVEGPEEAAAQPEDDDPLGLGAEDVENTDDTDTADEADGPDGEVKGGRFAPDSAKVQFNGQTISIADLKDHVDKRVRDFQRGFTEKTQAAAAREAEVNQYAQSLDESREYIAWYAEQFIPKQPEPFKGDARTDPQGFLEWQQDVAQWQTHVQAWQKFQADKEAEGQRKAGETQKQMQERHAREAEALFKAIPVLKDPAKGKQVWDNIVSGATQLGFTAEEVNGIRDHRMILALRKAIAYDRIKASAPKVQQEVTKRPVVNNARRAAPNAAQNREKQARTERLRNSGSFEDGVAALQDFDL